MAKFSSQIGLKKLVKDVIAQVSAPGLLRLMRLSHLIGLTPETSMRSAPRANVANGGPSHDAGQAVGANVRPTALGVWTPTTVGGVRSFRRLGASPWKTRAWSEWCDSEGFALTKTTDLRVVLLGESVARGFVYDPIVTPAMLLKERLQAVFHGSTVEVLDLAKTGLDPFELSELCERCLELRPDAVVVFAGNNWIQAIWEDGSHRTAHGAFLELVGAEGVRGIASHFRTELASFAENLLSRISAVFRTAGTPLVLMVPEFNLADWKHEWITPAWLETPALTEWLACQERIITGHQNRAHQEVASAAARCVALDDGLTSKPLEILAQCALVVGQAELAYRYATAARDAGIWMHMYTSPRCPGEVQGAIRACAKRGRHGLVDLPTVLKDLSDGEPPGRKWFLDYCHLTIEGLAVAMDQAAIQVGKLLQSPEAPAVKVYPCCLTSLNTLDDANAKFCTAVHNAHYSQDSDTVLYWCKRAIEADPAVIELMNCFCDCQLSGSPFWLVGGRFGRAVLRYLGAFQQFRVIDHILRDSVARAWAGRGTSPHSEFDVRTLDDKYLKRGCVGHDFEEFVGQYWRDDGNSAAGVARLSFMNCCCSIELSNVTRFSFITNGETDIAVELIVRTPDLNETSRALLALRVNASLVAAVECSTTWFRSSMRIPSKNLRKGLNFLQLDWPRAVRSRLEHIENILATGVIPEYGITFGELASLRLRAIES